MTFGENLIRLRRQQGLSQEQLGMRIGVSRQTVSKWELNDTTPEMEKLIALADLFGLSLDELTGRASPEAQAAAPGQPDAAETTSPFRVTYAPMQCFEYKSKLTLFGLPLVHICFSNGRPCVAKGVLAAGNIALGVFSLGGISAGLFSLGGVSAGLLLSLGGLSVGGLSIGGLAIGLFALGGLAVGGYSLGGCAVAARIAAGGFASAPIAIGDQTSGEITIDVHAAHSSALLIREAIRTRFPNTPQFLIDFFSLF